jgi:hypothetical protein
MKSIIKIKNNKIISKANPKNKELIKKAIKKVADFFKCKDINFEIIFLKTRKELDKINGSKTEKWVSGISKKNIIYTFEKDKFSKLTCYKNELFLDLLVYDISQIYLSKCMKIKFPVWIVEGTSQFIGNINEGNVYSEINLKNAFTKKEWKKNPCYNSSKRFIEYLINKNSKKRLLELLNSIKNIKNKREFNILFKKIFNKKLTTILEEWKKTLNPIIIIKNNKIISKTNKKNKKLIQKAIKKVNNFFRVENLNFKIIFLKTRKEFNELSNRKTKKWEVGIVKDNFLLMFDEDIYEKVSCHPKKDFFPTLVHEITHIYCDKIFNFTFPMWLSEGIAYVVANQDDKRLKRKQNILKAHSFEDWNEKPRYLTSGKFTRHLIKKYKKDKLISLMNLLEKYESKNNFNKKFKKILGKSFIKEFKNWKIY